MNHKIYENHILKIDTKYLHWTVSGGTQKLTLIKDGYDDFWYRLYNDARGRTEKTNDNKRILFESHKVAVSILASNKCNIMDNYYSSFWKR